VLSFCLASVFLSHQITSAVRIEAERAAAMRRAEKALGQQLQLNKELLQQLKQSGVLNRSSNGNNGNSNFTSGFSRSNRSNNNGSSGESSTPTTLRGSGADGNSSNFNNNFNSNMHSGNVSTGEARAVESLLRDRLGHFKLNKVYELKKIRNTGLLSHLSLCPAFVSSYFI